MPFLSSQYLLISLNVQWIMVVLGVTKKEREKLKTHKNK